MADGRAKNGGARPGAGRKPKAVSDELRALFDKCVTQKDREAIVKQMVQDALSPSLRTRIEARKLLLAYMFGTPIARHEVEGELDINMPSPEELKKKFAERRKSIEALDD